MSIAAITAVLQHSRAQASTKLVLVSLAWHADAAGLAWPLQATLARHASITDRQVRKALRELELTARLKDAGGLDGWRAALTKIRETAGLRGENDRRWRCDFDWLIGETAFFKLMEGKYDEWGTKPANGDGRSSRVGRSSDKRAAYDAVFTGLAATVARKGSFNWDAGEYYVDAWRLPERVPDEVRPALPRLIAAYEAAQGDAARAPGIDGKQSAHYGFAVRFFAPHGP